MFFEKINNFRALIFSNFSNKKTVFLHSLYYLLNLFSLIFYIRLHIKYLNHFNRIITIQNSQLLDNRLDLTFF